jgi:predicted transcriptional regulator
MGKPKDETLHIKISGELKESLNKVADSRDISAAQVVREAIQEKVGAFEHSGHSLAHSPEVEATANS